MNKIRRNLSWAGLALSAMLSSGTAQAYDELVVFGDSFSDNGNLYNAVIGLLPGPPYYQGRFTNGPVAVEVMAETLDIPLVNFAFGGASSGINNQYLPGSPSGLRGRVNFYLDQLQSAGQIADADDLYIVWGGGNDLLSPITAGRRDNMQTLIDTVVGNLAGSVTALYGAGARDVLMPLLPDMATSFYGTSGQIPATFLSGVSQAFNDTLRQRADVLEAANPGLNVRIFDTPAVLQPLRDGIAAAGGNVTDRCWSGEFNGQGTLCADPDTYYLFDRVHPTAIVHRTVGVALAVAVVPEPSAWALLIAGGVCALVVTAGRRKKNGRAHRSTTV